MKNIFKSWGLITVKSWLPCRRSQMRKIWLVTDEELKEQIKTQAEAAGFSDVDEYKSAAKMDPEELREVMMSTKVFEFLEGKVTFNKKVRDRSSNNNRTLVVDRLKNSVVK